MAQQFHRTKPDNRRRITVLQRLRYRFDNSLSRGLAPMIGLLAMVTMVVVLIAGFVLWLGDVDLNGERAKGIEGVWASLLRTLDPGTMGSDRGWLFRVTSLAVTVAGIFIVSTLIGILANGLSQRLDELRRGRSEVIETGHTLVLGWSPKVFLIIREIAAAATPSERPCVVVLADRDMVEMEEQFRKVFRRQPNIRLVSRSGDPAAPRDLASVAPNHARSVVILRNETSGDAAAVRTVLALDHLGMHRSIPVIVELAEAHRAEAIAAAAALWVEPVVSSEWIASITSRAIRTPWLIDVYEDFLNFEGSEIYFCEVPPWLAGRSLSAACASIEGGAPFGIRRNGVITLAPDADQPLELGDELVLITGSRQDVWFSGTERRQDDQSADGQRIILPRQVASNVLILGWSDLGLRVLNLLDQALAPGSRVEVVAPSNAAETLRTRTFKRFTLHHSFGSPTDPKTLRTALGRADISRILVLSTSNSDRSIHDDADALLTVLELRQLLSGRPDIQVTVEINDPENVSLVLRDAREEFIVGERLVCLLMSQVSQTHGVMEVLRSLLADDETDLSVLPASAVLSGRASIDGTSAAALLRSRGHYLIGAGHPRSLRLQPRLSDLTISEGMELVTMSSTKIPQEYEPGLFYSPD